MASKQQQMTMKLDNNYSTDGCYNDDKHNLNKEERKKIIWMMFMQQAIK